jgi:ribulose-phosphate 3-epimerase
MKPVKIAPSILAGDLGNLRSAVEIAVKGKADLVHVDVIDGHFAPNISFGAGTIRALRGRGGIPFDVHLMIDQPRWQIHNFLEAGSDRVIIQVETIDEAIFDSLFAIVRSYGREIGLALRPETELPKWVESRLGRLSTLLILTVNPGFSGQKMDVKQFPKIERIAKLMAEKGVGTDLEIDGGIDERNVHEVAKRGGDTFVAGAGVYAQPDPVQAIANIRENATKAKSAT